MMSTLTSLAPVLFGSVIFGIRSLWNRTLQHRKQVFSGYFNPAHRLIMKFFRAFIFSIAALAFTASASPASCYETGVCAQDDCTSDEQCGPNCFCSDMDPERVSSLLLLLARSKLTCNHLRSAAHITMWRNSVSAWTGMKIRVRAGGMPVLKALLSRIDEVQVFCQLPNAHINPIVLVYLPWHST